MANEYTRDRGNLFTNAQKLKPSQPDFQGECTIEGTTYEIRAWRREEQLTISLAPPRGDRNTYPPDTFRGVLEAGPARPARPGARAAKEAVSAPAWAGDIVSDDAAYTLRAAEKQGKHGLYYTLSFERIERPAKPPEPAPYDMED
jgi:hypothetical protein